MFGVGFKEDGHPLFCEVSAPGKVIIRFLCIGEGSSDPQIQKSKLLFFKKKKIEV